MNDYFKYTNDIKKTFAAEFDSQFEDYRDIKQEVRIKILKLNLKN